MGGKDFLHACTRLRGPLDEILSLTSTWCPLGGAKEQVDQSDRIFNTALAILPNFLLTGYILLEMKPSSPNLTIYGMVNPIPPLEVHDYC